MKTNVVAIAVFSIVAFSFLIVSSCKKTNNTPPVVTLNGASSYTISLQSNYTELNAKALSNQNAIITPVVSGSVNTNLVGTYTITYTATDNIGNIGTATRTVTVVNDANIYSGTYTCTDTALGGNSPFTQVVTASTTLNNLILFSKFANLSGNNTIEAILTGGTAFSIIDATVNGLGANGCTLNYSANGVGAAITSNAGKYSFSVKYSKAQIASGTSCPAIAAIAYEDMFVQQ